MPPNDTLPTIAFPDPDTFEVWLAENHQNSPGLWLKLFKKDSGIPTIRYAEALDIALCYGWIDGQKQRFDDQAFLQKFCPRREKSIWSKINIGHIERLSQEGRMQPAGMAAVERAKTNGQWDLAYDSPGNMTLPEDFLKALRKNKKAEAFFNSLNKTNVFSIGFRLQTARKPETREKRMKQILDMLSRGEKFH